MGPMKVVSAIRHKLRRLPIWILSVAAVLIAARLALPPLGFWFINKELRERLGQYTGSITDFDLTLYRGAYQLQGLEIRKRDSSLPPLLSVRQINLSLAWRALLRKELTGDITADQLVVRLTDSTEKNKQQFGTEEKKERWQDAFDLIIPLSIESLHITRSSLFFTNNDLKEPLPIRLERIDLKASDLRTQTKEVSSPFTLQALLQKHAPLSITGRINILSTPLKADVDFKLTDFQLNTVNKLLRIYVPLDVTKGRLDIYGEVATAQSEAVGYVKVFLEDGDIIAPRQKFSSPKHLLFEIGSAFANWVLKNNKTRKIAVYIPFERRNRKFDIDGTDAFWSAIENKWDEIQPGLDRSVHMASLKQKKVKTL